MQTRNNIIFMQKRVPYQLCTEMDSGSWYWALGIVGTQLNPMENLCYIMERKVASLKIITIDHLKGVIKKIWTQEFNDDWGKSLAGSRKWSKTNAFLINPNFFFFTKASVYPVLFATGIMLCKVNFKGEFSWFETKVFLFLNCLQLQRA